MSKEHKWQFAARFRACAFGWRASRLAAQRLKEAVSEIRKAGRSDPVLAAEGAIKLIEKLWPALQQIDTSSGLLGSAVNSAVHEVIQYAIEAQVDLKTREKWLERLWVAFQEDGVDYTMEVSDRWGELCGSDELRQKWLEELMPFLQESWFTGGNSSYFRGDSACLSCLLKSGRYQELLDLLKRHSSRLWHTQRFGVKALVALGRLAEALDYADQLRGPYASDSLIDQECEAILLSIGKRQEAYSRYAFSANRRGTGVATFRALSEKYPEKDPKKILDDLIRLSPGTEGKWFATARQLGFLDLAVKLALTSPCEPRTLNRAAKDLLAENPSAALAIAMSSLRWICEGAAYDLSGMDVYSACSSAMKAADTGSQGDETARQIALLTRHHPFVYNFCRQVDPRIAKADSGG
ncbi:MAG TPA: hypothetical protein VN673_05270 [Clostridia bacterium]|nr:hypothetical protein [Clostridia bacterium]